MGIVAALKEVQTFINENICSNLTFKRPPNTEGLDAREYDYELVQPKAYLMYPPEQEKFPSITIQVIDGEADRVKTSGEMKIRLLFATWGNGQHFKNKNGAPEFNIDSEGWYDAWNLLDKALMILNHTTYFGEKVRLKHEDKIQFGSMKEENIIANYYPYWFAWLTCTIQYGQISSNKDVNDLI